MKVSLYSILFMLAISCSSFVRGQDGEKDYASLRDSLDAISIPFPVYKDFNAEITLHIKSQKQWDGMAVEISNLLKQGHRYIEVIVDAKTLTYGEKVQALSNLNYPNANIRILARNTKMIPAGPSFERKTSKRKGTFYVCQHSDFDRNDVLFDEKDNPLTLYSPVFLIDTPIEEDMSSGTEEILNKDNTLYKKICKVWRFKTNLLDLNEAECRQFQILLTRNWTSMRHQVVKVEDGYLYFNLKSDEAPTLLQMTMNPNVDTQSYKTYPRCRYFNCPVSDGVHIISERIFIPQNIKSIHIGKGARLLTVNDVNLNSLEISGFNVSGAGNSACISVSHSKFNEQMWIRDNRFANLSSSAVSIHGGENISIFKNTIENTRGNAMSCHGSRISVWGNHLRDIGFMYQTMAIGFAGTDIHISDNTIEDFCYSAIACGGRDSSRTLTYIVERNLIRHSQQFIAHYKERTVADGGGIYIGPQNTRGIIRSNVIQNIIGIGSNRGIFLDDGCKNLAIYGNLIQGTANSYDIDLRYCTTYEKELPDHNTNNAVFQNIMTGGYRFQDGGKDNHCMGGMNLLLGIELNKKTIVDIRESLNDMSIWGCYYKKGRIVIPKQDRAILDKVRTDSFVRGFMDFQEVRQ